MGDLFDNFGGYGGRKQPKAPEPTFTYTAPDLRAIYESYAATGKVPYSYYGQGAPTDADELARVRAAYPGAFTQPPTSTQPQPSSGQRPVTGIDHMKNLFRVFMAIPTVGKPDSQMRRAIEDSIQSAQALKNNG